MNNSVFISYSRQERAFVDRLATDLRNCGFSIWRDTEALVPGTANWQKAIRKAIEAAEAVVLVASPGAMQSDYVQGELAVAKQHKCPVFPIWAVGREWIACVPLEMVNVQYADARKNYELGITNLCDSLRASMDKSAGKIRIGLPTHDTLTLNLATIPDLDTLLNKIYMFHLSWWCEPFTYGKDWVLGNVETNQVALPWKWLEVANGETLQSDDPHWDNIGLKEVNIRPNDYWGVWDASKFPTVGIAVNNSTIVEKLQSDSSIKDLIKLYQEGTLKLMQHQKVKPKAYSHKFFIGFAGALASFGIGLIKEFADGTPVDLHNIKDKVVFVEAE